MTETIRLEVVSRSDRGRSLISDISFTLHPRQIIAMIGPNGAGKSTLLRVVAGLDAYDGEIFYGTEPLKRRSFLERAAWVSYVPQRTEALPPFSVREFVRLSRYRMGGKLDGAEVDRALALTGCDGLADRLLYRLSGGELQRVVIAGAVAQDAKFLLLDEPANAFDPLQAQIFRRLIRKIAAEMGRGIIVVTHDIQHLPLFASRVVALRDGRMVGDSAINESGLIDLVSKTFDLPYGSMLSQSGKRSLLIQLSEEAHETKD
jgi:iron complex transport system ATP-binding protein